MKKTGRSELLRPVEGKRPRPAQAVLIARAVLAHPGHGQRTVVKKGALRLPGLEPLAPHAKRP